MIATLVDPASPDFSPCSLARRCCSASPACSACSAAILLAIALEQFRRRIDTAADVAQHTLAPVLGRLGRQRSLSRSEPPR